MDSLELESKRCKLCSAIYYSLLLVADHEIAVVKDVFSLTANHGRRLNATRFLSFLKNQQRLDVYYLQLLEFFKKLETWCHEGKAEFCSG